MTMLNGRLRPAEMAAYEVDHDALAVLYRPLVRTLLRMPPRGLSDSLLVGLTGCARGEGVTTVAIDLAWAAAHGLSQSVALVDAHPAHPDLGSMLAPHQEQGMADAIISGQDPSQFAAPFLLENLNVLPAGSPETRAQLFDDASRFLLALAQLR